MYLRVGKRLMDASYYFAPDYDCVSCTITGRHASRVLLFKSKTKSAFFISVIRVISQTRPTFAHLHRKPVISRQCCPLSRMLGAIILAFSTVLLSRGFPSVYFHARLNTKLDNYVHFTFFSTS